MTVVPRGRALGVAFSLPEEDKYSRNRGWLLDRIKICYGGFVAEELMFGETTTGVHAGRRFAKHQFLSHKTAVADLDTIEQPTAVAGILIFFRK